MAKLVVTADLADPMSGFFMITRPAFEGAVRRLSGQGFKILLDLVLSAPTPLRVKEVPAVFHERVAGESKLDALVALQFLGLLLDKTFAGFLPLRFASFAAGFDSVELWRGANDRDHRCDGVQFRIEQCDYVCGSATARAQIMAGIVAVHGGLRGGGGGQYRHCQGAV